MTRRFITRRTVLGAIGLGAASVVLAACGSASSPTAPPAATPAAGGGAKTPVTIAVWEFPDRPWQATAAADYQKAHPEVELKIDKMVYGEYDKKQLALLATGTLQDIVFSGVKWFPTSTFKGAFLSLDDLAKAKDPGLADFVPAALAGSKFEGKLYALPFEANPGNYNVVMYNKELLDAKGVKPPTDEWTYEQFGEMAKSLTDKAKKIWGTDSFYPGNYYDQNCIARSYGGDMFSEDAKKFQYNSDPASIKAAQWHYDLINKLEAAPKRADKEGLSFPSGRIALGSVGIQSVKGLSKTIADKFKWDVVLGPTGPGGNRGTDGFVTMYSLYAKTKVPEKAYELMMYETSKEV